MANLLVTGSAGFIGANFVHYWLANYPNDRLIVLDALTYAGNVNNLQTVVDHPAFRFVYGNIRNYELVCGLLREEKIDILVNFAAESHVDNSIETPDDFIETNVVGTHTLLKAAKLVWLDSGQGREHHFHHVSTDEVYGTLQPEDPPFTETTPYAPNSPYAASKAASDHLVRAYHHTYGLVTTTSNCSNNYGPYQYPEKLIPLMITRALHHQNLPVYGDGIQVRDWLHVDDHNRGIEHIIQQGRWGEVYNIGGANEWKNIDLVTLICHELDQAFATSERLAQSYPKAPQVTGKSATDLITFVKDRPGHDRRYAIDNSKITTELGYQPLEPFETGIKKTIAWYLNHEAWWRDAMSRQS